MSSTPVEALAQLISRGEDEASSPVGVLIEELVKRVNIPINSTTPPLLVEAIKQDPFQDAAKYGLLYVYVGIILVVTTTLMRLYYYWGDKIRTALYKEEVINSASTISPVGASPGNMYGTMNCLAPPAK